MKKITLFAAAALAGSTAVAAVPQLQSQASAQRIDKVGLTNMRAEKVVSGLNLNNVVKDVKPLAEEGDDVVTITNDVDYVLSSNAFYTSFAANRYRLTVPRALTGIRNAIGFLNLTDGADAFKWTYGRIVGLNEDRTEYIYEYTNSEERNLYMDLAPMARFTYPTLSATFGTDEVTRTPDNPNSLVYCGHGPLDWGWTTAAADATEVSYEEIYGVTNCSAVPGATLFPEYAIERPGCTGYDARYNDANGTSLNWYAYSDDDFKLEDIVIKSFATYIPPMPSPYQLDAMWMWIQTEAKADLSLTINIYSVTEEGQVNYDELIGTGELTVPEGAFAVTGSNTMPVVLINAVDEDGYAIDSPLCVGEGQDIFVRIEGLDNPDLLMFDVVANENTTFPVDTPREIANAMWPNRAYTIFSANATYVPEGATEATTENREFMLGAPYNYYADDTRTTLITPSNFLWMFNVNFPVVLNDDENSADFGTADFNAALPAAGGETVVPVACDYKIDVLMEMGLVEALASDWITFNQVYDEETGLTNVTISAEALPEDTAARTGYVVYMGYAIDFVITVQQGEESGIENITVKPVAKGTKFFDMQGRQLKAAPARGMYIESVDGKATKQIAR